MTKLHYGVPLIPEEFVSANIAFTYTFENPKLATPINCNVKIVSASDKRFSKIMRKCMPFLRKCACNPAPSYSNKMIKVFERRMPTKFCVGRTQFSHYKRWVHVIGQVFFVWAIF